MGELGVFFDSKLAFSTRTIASYPVALFESPKSLTTFRYTLSSLRFAPSSFLWICVGCVERNLSRSLSRWNKMTTIKHRYTKGYSTIDSFSFPMMDLLHCRRANSDLLFRYELTHGLIERTDLLTAIYLKTPTVNHRASRLFHVPAQGVNNPLAQVEHLYSKFDEIPFSRFV